MERKLSWSENSHGRVLRYVGLDDLIELLSEIWKLKALDGMKHVYNANSLAM